MLASQFILIGILILIIIKTLVTSKSKKLPIVFSATWLSIWVIGLITVINPFLLSSFARLLHIGRGVDLAVYTSIILLFYLIYSLFIRQNEIEKKITQIVREKALKDVIGKK
jgi:small membrane protein